MARELSEYDLSILRKLAGSTDVPMCEHVGSGFRSILPPLWVHYRLSREQLTEGLRSLSDEELEYLVEQVRRGEESLHCAHPDHVQALLDEVDRMFGRDVAMELFEIYRLMSE